MAIVHSYTLGASAAGADALRSALEDLAAATRTIPGSQGAMVLADRKEPGKFLFLEFWDSEESRKAAGSQLPKDVMGRIMASVSGPLQMAGYDRISG